MKIQRYEIDTDGEAYKHHKGDYVKFSDLQDLIDAAPVVFCNMIDSSDMNTWTASEIKHPIDTHSARLMFIEELKQECVRHDPGPVNVEGFGCVTIGEQKCIHCGIKIYADWKPKGGV